jgi:hypothetical protein
MRIDFTTFLYFLNHEYLGRILTATTTTEGNDRRRFSRIGGLLQQMCPLSSVKEPNIKIAFCLFYLISTLLKTEFLLSVGSVVLIVDVGS